MPAIRPLHVAKRYSTIRAAETFIDEIERQHIAERLSSSQSSPVASPQPPRAEKEVLRFHDTVESDAGDTELLTDLPRAETLEVQEEEAQTNFESVLCDLLRGMTGNTDNLSQQQLDALTQISALMEQNKWLARRVGDLEEDNRNLIASMNQMTDAMLLNEEKLREYEKIIEQKVNSQ